MKPRIDYSASELYSKPISFLRSYPDNVRVWHSATDVECLKDYIEWRLWMNRVETERGAR